jgi:DNA-binding response OmpR family regulator
MSCGPAAGRCCGASGKPACNCAPETWSWTAWTTRRGAGNQPIVLTNKEFALLEHLMLNRGQCVSRVELLDAVWNLEPAQTTNIVDVYVNYLRRKLKILRRAN